MRFAVNNSISHLRFDEAGLLPAIVQESGTKQVLMLAYMNRESLQRTLETGETHFWSRSRNELWHKGATSGNIQRVRNIAFDCDADSLLIEVDQVGDACHTGAHACFFNTLTPTKESKEDIGSVLMALERVIARRKSELPHNSYTAYLFKSGLDKILKKVGEESAETIIAAKNHNKEQIVFEASDLLYHVLVLLAEENVSLDSIAAALTEREGKNRKEP